MKAYKLVRRVDGKLVSCNKNLPEKFTETYIPGEWTEVKGIEGSGLYYFKGQDSAIQFAKSHSQFRNLELWGIETEDEIEVARLIWFTATNDEDEYEIFIDALWNSKKIEFTKNAIDLINEDWGCARRIKLIEKLGEYNV